MADQTSHEPNYCARHDMFDCWLCAWDGDVMVRGVNLRCWLHEDDQICPVCTS